MTPLTVLILNWTGEYGGVEKHLWTLANALDRARYRLIFASPGGNFIPMLREAGFEWHAVEMPPGLRPADARAIARIVRERGVDILHPQQSRTLNYAVAARLLAPGPRIVQTEHNVSIDWYRRKQLSWRTRHLGNALRFVMASTAVSRVVCISSGVARLFTDVARVGAGRLTVIPYAHPPLPQRERKAFDPAAPVFGTVSVPREHKGIPHLIEAAAIARERVPGLRVRVVGHGSVRDQYAAQIARLGLERAVSIEDFAPDATRLMGEFDAFVLPSIWEAFGLVVLEAMANGVPVIASDVDGMRDVVLNGETGWLVPAADPPALAAAMLDACSDAARLARMGERGRERCAREFSAAKMASRFAAVYDAVGRQPRT